MGTYSYTDDQTGKTYTFNHGGDTPSDQDWAEMAQIIDQDRARLNELSQRYSGQEIAPEDDSWALGRGIDVGKTTAYSALGTTMRDLGESTGFGWLEGMGRGMEQSAKEEQLREATQMPATTRWEDVTGLGSGLTFLGEVAGQSGPEMAATLGATAAGTVVGGPAAGLAAGASTAMPFFYGRDIQRQEQQIAAGELAEKNRLNAFLAAGGQSALNVIGDKLLLTGKLFGINIPLSKKLFVRSAQVAGTGAATEIPTEITQQILERAQAGMSLDSDEAIQEYIEVGIAAGLLGGAIGGATGPFRSPTARGRVDEEAPTVEDVEQAVEDADAPLLLTPEQRVPRDPSDFQQEPDLFGGLEEQTRPEPYILSPDQRIRPGEQLELDLPQPRVLQPSERVDAQGELDLTMPVGAQADMFAAQPPMGRPALEVLDELGVAPRAPIRKRVASAISTDNRFLEELKRYARLPGIKKATRTTIEDYVAQQEAAIAPTEPELAPSPKTTEATPDVKTTPKPIDEGVGAGVPSPEPSVAGRGRGARASEDTGAPATPDMGPVGVGSAPAASPTVPTGEQPSAVEMSYDATPDPDRKGKPVRRIVAANTDGTVGAVEGEVVDGTNQLQVYNASMKPDLRNQGLGTQMYQELIANAEKEGLSVVSDTSVSPSAARVYEALSSRGYTVERSPAAKTRKDGNVQTSDGSPVFTVASASAAQPAPQAAPEAAPAAEPKMPNLRRPVVQEPTLRRPEGATISPTGQLIPAGIEGVQGKQLEEQAAAQREPIAAQMAKKAKLEAEVADLKATLASKRKLSTQAKEGGVKRTALETKLRTRVNSLNSQLYSITSYLRSAEGQAQAETEGTQNYMNMLEGAEDDALRLQLRDWYEMNAPEDIKAYDADVRGEANFLRAAQTDEQAIELKRRMDQQIARRDPTNVVEKRKLLELLSMTPQQLKKDENARAAYAYFSKTRDTADAMENIAFDIADPDTPKRRIGAPKKGVVLESYWKGTGKTAAQKAAAWVDANMPDAAPYIDEKTVEFSTENGKALGAALDKEIMRRAERDKAETDYLKRYIDAETALRDTEAFEGTTPEAMTREELRALDAESMGTDIDFAEIGIDIGRGLYELPRRSISYGLEAPLHPAIVKALNAGNLQRALEGIAATNVDPYIQNLAATLATYVGDVSVETTATQPRASQLLRQKDGQMSQGGYYVMNKAEYAAFAEEYGVEAADQLQNTIFLNAATGFNAHTILHETVHAATQKAIQDPANPVRQRLQTLFDGVEPLLDGDYGLENLREFVAEAMSNQEFQTKLSQIYPTPQKVSAFTQFWQSVANFVRTKLLRREARDYKSFTTGPEVGLGRDSVFDEVDFLVRTIFDAAPDFRIEGPLFEDALIPLRAQKRLSTMAGKVKDFKDLDRKKIDAALGDMYIPMTARKFLVDALVPLVNLIDMAKGYFPNAIDLYKTLTGHAGAIHKMNERVRQTVDDISKNVSADKMDLFNRVRLIASELQIDPRRPRSHYEGFTLVYKKIAENGEITSTEIESFPTKEARDARVSDLNAERQIAETAGRPMTRTKARNYADFDKDNLAAYDKLRADWEALGSNGQKAYNQVVALFEHMHRETGRVLKARLEAMMPFQKKLANELYQDLYNKIIADQVIVPYQPLQRQGNFWLQYSARDPRAEDPKNAPIVLFKQSFKTSADREAAMAQLRSLQGTDPDLEITDIQPYIKSSDLFNPERNTPPSKFVMDIGTLLDRQAKERAAQVRREAIANGQDAAVAETLAKQVLDQEKARSGDTHAEIVKLALEMTPERSLLNSYRKRQNVRGYLGDVTPLDTKLSKSDTINFLLQKGSSLSRQLANMEYGAQARAIVNQMEAEFDAKVGSGTWGSKEQEKAVVYLNAFKEYGNSIYSDRAAWSKALTSLGFGMTLGANVSSAFMNFMAIPTIIAPYLGGKYGFRQTNKAIGQAMKTIAGSGRERVVEYITEEGTVGRRTVRVNAVDYSLDNYDLKEGDKYYYLAQEARERGLFHNSINYDTLDIEGSMGQGIWHKMNRVSGFMFHHLERYVRESTLIAAYDLELQKIQAEKAKRGQPTEITVEDKQAAAREAAYATEMTNGSIASTAAPAWAKGNLGSVLYLFKRYPLSMYNLLATLANKSFPSKAKLAEMYGEGTPEYEAGLEMRKIARMQLGSILGSVGLFAGAAGLPMYGAITGVLDAMFTDEDEEDFDTVIRKGIGELGFKGLGNYLLGVEVSSRIGLANMFYREPLRASDQPFLFNILEGAGGPVVGLMINYTDRVPSFLGDGEYYRALEAGMPAAVRNALRATRFAQNGAETLRGDDIYDDFGPMSILGQMLGFAPAAYIRQLEENTQLKNIDTAIVGEKSRLLRKLNLARREGNREGMRDAVEDIRRYNRRHPQQAITQDTISKSARTFEQTTQRVINGMIFNTRNIPMLKQMAAEYDSPTTFWEQFGLK